MLTSHGTGFARIFDDVSSKYELETRIRDMLDVGEGQLEAATEQRTLAAKSKSSADATQNGKRDSRAAALPKIDAPANSCLLHFRNPLFMSASSSLSRCHRKIPNDLNTIHGMCFGLFRASVNPF